jgi:hypothetical protein
MFMMVTLAGFPTSGTRVRVGACCLAPVNGSVLSLQFATVQATQLAQVFSLEVYKSI